MSSPEMAQLQPLEQRGWRAGLSPLMRAGFAAWWKTNDWWIQALLWTAVINGSVAVAIWGDAPEELDVFTLYGVMTMFAAIAVAIIMQEAIVGEKRSGTAAWVLSKPASRDAFMLAKLVPNAVGIVVTMIVVPSTVLLIQLVLADVEVSVPRFWLGAAVAALNLLFYLTLTLMLGTLFDSAGPVIAIPGVRLRAAAPRRDPGPGRGPAVVAAGGALRLGHLSCGGDHHRGVDSGARGASGDGWGMRDLHSHRVREMAAHRVVRLRLCGSRSIWSMINAPSRPC
jgi:hypothetical protein